jgi:cytochrome c
MLNIAIAIPAFGEEQLNSEQIGGEQLMEKSGCISCHRVDQKLIGPSFKSVAAKYKEDNNAPAQLFLKIREGGEGIWGDIPMISNDVNKISDADLQTVIQWILSL